MTSLEILKESGQENRFPDTRKYYVYLVKLFYTEEFPDIILCLVTIRKNYDTCRHKNIIPTVGYGVATSWPVSIFSCERIGAHHKSDDII